MSDFGITIEGIHTSSKGLKMLGYSIPMPEPELTRVKVPGKSGKLDLSRVMTGYTTYGDRENVSFRFRKSCNWDEYEVIKSELAEMVHGKKVKVVLDNDLSFYYVCELELHPSKESNTYAIFEFKGTAEPFKYEITSSDEDWLWDSFDFEEGVIRELKDIEITSDFNEVTILAGDYSVSPTFIVEESINLAVVHNGYTYNLPVGTTRIPSIRVGDKDVTLTFTGSGKLNISYRGEYL